MGHFPIDTDCPQYFALEMRELETQHHKAQAKLCILARQKGERLRWFFNYAKMRLSHRAIRCRRKFKFMDS